MPSATTLIASSVCDLGGGSPGQHSAAAEIEWDTGDVWVHYTDGNPESGSEKSTGIVAHLAASTGSTLGATTTSSGGVFDVISCGLALDQRGRLYTFTMPCLGVNAQESIVYSTAGFDALKIFSGADVCQGSGAASFGVKVDVKTDPSVASTRFTYMSSSGGADGGQYRNYASDTDPAIYDFQCSFTNGGGGGGSGVSAYWRDDGTASDFFWNTDGAGLLRVTEFDTCTTTTVTAATSAGMSCTMDSDSLNCFTQTAGSGMDLEPCDEADTTVEVGCSTIISLPGSEIPDPLDDGLEAKAIRMWNVIRDLNGDYISCGLVSHTSPGGTQYVYLAKFNGAFDTQDWNITSLASTWKPVNCDLGRSGEIIWYGALQSTGQLQLKKFCCNEAGVQMSDEVYEQIILPAGTPTPTPGALFNVDGNTIPGVGAFGANLFFGVLMIAGMTVTMGASPMAFEGSRGFRFSVALAVIGAILGFFMAWAFGFLSNAAVFVVVILSIVVIGFYVAKRGG